MKCKTSTTIHPQKSLAPDLSPPSGEAQGPGPKIPGTTDLHPHTTRTARHIHSMSKHKVAFPSQPKPDLLKPGTQGMHLCAPNGTRQQLRS